MQSVSRTAPTLIRLGVVTGLAREAACLDVFPPHLRPRVACAGASPRRAAEATRRLIDQGCAGIVSFGVAGGLSPDAPPGTLILPEEVVTAGGEARATDGPWRQRLIQVLPGGVTPLSGPLLGTLEPALTAREKRRLWQASQGCAVDTESFAIVHTAGEAGVPVIAIRTVADAWERSIPPWMAAVIDAQGRTSPSRLARGLLRRPWQLVDLAAAGLDFRRALQTLRRVAVDAGPLLQLDG